MPKPFLPRSTFPLAIILLFLAVGICSTGNTATTKKPNVFLISLDTVGSDHLSAYGYFRETSPFLEQFSRDAILFEKSYSQAAFTLPSHYSMFTGVFPQTHQVIEPNPAPDNSNSLSPKIKTLTEYLKNNGYSTHWLATTTDPYLNLKRGLERGFDFIEKIDFGRGTYGLSRISTILQNAPKEGQFFFIHTYLAHDPYSPAEPYSRIFNPSYSGPDIIPPANRIDGKKTYLNRSSEAPFRTELRAMYDGGIRTLDDKLKELINLIQRHGFGDSSLIIITSDHGDSFGEHDHFFHKWPYQNELRVPLVMKLPSQPPQRVSTPVYGIDIMPTVLDALHIPKEGITEGRSLLPLLRGESIPPLPFLFFAGSQVDAISDGDFKLLTFQSGREELYHLKVDPFEKENVLATHAEEKVKLKAELEAFRLKQAKYLYFADEFRSSTRLYWFIPDGMRADRDEFNIFKWASEGKLPNIKKMMDEGAWGYSIPDFPSHTPINFASLLTGSHPSKHGIADGPMHVEGAPLKMPSASGFSSTSKKIPPAWRTLEKAGKSVLLLSVPGSTPPEIKGVTIRGRWGGWGADSYNMVFESNGMTELRKKQGRAFRLFFLGEPLTQFVETSVLPDHSVKANLSAHGSVIRATLFPKTKKMEFQIGETVVSLRPGEWSDWLPLELQFKDIKYPSMAKIKLIKLWPDQNFRIRVLYNNLNRLNVDPPSMADYFNSELGPMVDHLDNWPPQLIFEKEDKEVAMDEVRMSLDWHRRAAQFLVSKVRPDVVIHNTYTPNQMLESRWWHGKIDKTRPLDMQDKKSKKERAREAKAAWKDILKMYQGLDAVLGEVISKVPPENVVVALSSDHGVCPLHRLVHLNNLFAKKGWLKFTTDPKTGESTIDWKNTKVVYLKMLHVYINPNGLDGNWSRQSGPEYDKLRDEVLKALSEVKDLNGVAPLVKAVKWEDAAKTYDLPLDRIGDLVLETRVNYFWYEEVDESLQIFSNPLTTGYKQSLNPEKNECMWTPFLVWGRGIKKGVHLKNPISHVDQLPTLLKALNVPIPGEVQGKVLTEALE